MKKVFFWFFLALTALLVSCKPEVDLFADYKQVPIIYGLLDGCADTNYIKITRAFYAEDNIEQVAQIADSSDYPGKLDVRLVEFCNGDSVREIILDTITIHNKVQGAFYAPSQKLYYTTEPLHINGEINRYSYRLKVALPDRVLTADADMVGSTSFGVQSLAVDFSKVYFGQASRRFLFRPALNAGFYDVSMSFTFKEQRTPDGDTLTRTMHWWIGSYSEYDLSMSMDFGCYVFQYRPEHFYEALEAFIGADTAVVGLTRFLNDYPVEVTVMAGGEQLRQYVHNNDGSVGFNPGDNQFSLIEGGYGCFSSRMSSSQWVRLAGETVPDLVGDPKWGFKFMGGTD